MNALLNVQSDYTEILQYYNASIYVHQVHININNNVYSIVLNHIYKVMIYVRLNAIKINSEMDGNALIARSNAISVKILVMTSVWIVIKGSY